MESGSGDGASLLRSALISAGIGTVFALISLGLVTRALAWILATITACIPSSRKSPKIASDSPAEAPPAAATAQPKKPAPQAKPKPSLRPPPKPQAAPKHRLELNIIKGHTDAITGLAFTSTGHGLATACADRLVRVFKLDDATSKNQQCLRLNLPPGCVPTGVAFGEGASQVVVVTQEFSGAGLLMYGAAEGKAAAMAKEQGKLPPPEIKWRKDKIHDKKIVLTCVGARSEHGSGDGGVIVATCSEGTDIKLWQPETGKCLGLVDTNQLKNSMATVSPDGRFLTAAAFTADVKIWEIVYGKDGQIREVVKVMLLKGHKSAVTWACFTWDSKRVITVSKDGSIRIWNIDVRYHQDEDPKCLKTFPISNTLGYYEKIAVSPDNKTLAAIEGTTLSWLSTEDGRVLDSAANAHDGEITCIAWAPQGLATDNGKVHVLATASADKRIKLWSGVV